MTDVLTVLHLAGSPVDDFFADLSRLYAADCLEAVADPQRYDHRVAWVEPGGLWRFPTDLSREALAAAEALDVGAAVTRIREIAPDVAVPQLFCLPGMTTYRSLLDLLGVPFVGNTADVMALGAHKARAKAVVRAAGVVVPAGVVGRAPELDDDAWAPLGLPVVVKPVDADNSSGVSLVHDAAEVEGAVAAAAAESATGEAMIEEYVALGREVRCGVVETDDGLRALPLEEYAVDTDTKPVRDRADKLSGAGDDLSLVAKDADHAWIVDADDPLVPRVQEAAERAFRALGCRDYGLFDFRVAVDGTPVFLEAGLYCSFARTSVVAVMAKAAGQPLPDFFAAMVARATAR